MQTRAFAWIAVLLVACNADPDPNNGASPDATPVADAMPGCTQSGVTEAEATRATDAAAVTVSVTLRNALEHCAKSELAFGLVFDTHSFDLLGIDIAASARIETSTGGELGGDLTWSPGSESSHHRDGVLTAPAPALDGAEWLRLTVADVAGVDRVFEWNASFLAHELP